MRRSFGKRWVLVFILLAPAYFIIISLGSNIPGLYGKMAAADRPAQGGSGQGDMVFARDEARTDYTPAEIARIVEERDALKKEVETAVSIKSFNKVCSEKYNVLQELNALKEKQLTSVKMEDYKDILSEKTNLAKEVARLKEANVRLGERIAEYSDLEARLAAEPQPAAAAPAGKGKPARKGASGEKPSAAVPGPSKEAAVLLSQKESLEKEVARLNKANASLETRLAEYKGMESKYTSHAQEASATAQEIAKLKESNALLEARLGEFANMGSILESQARERAALNKEKQAFVAEKEAVNKAMSDVEARNRELEEKLKDYEAMKAEVKNRPHELEVAIKEKSEAVAGLEALKGTLKNMVTASEYNTVLAERDRLSREAEKYSTLSKELDAAMKTNSELAADIESMKSSSMNMVKSSDYNALLADKDSIAKEFEKLRQANLDLEAKIAERDKSLEAALKANNDLSTEVVSLRGSSMNAVQVSEYNTVLAEKESLQNELKKMREASPNMEEKLAELAEAGARIAEQSKELEAAAEAKEKLISEIDSLKAGSANMIRTDEYDRVLVAKEGLEKELEQLRDSVAVMQDKVADYKDMQAKYDAQSKDLDAVTRENSDLAAQIEALKNDMQNMIKAEEYNGIFSEKEKLSKELDRLKEANIGLEARVSENEQLEAKLASLSSQVDILTKDKQNMLSAMDAIKAENVDVRTEIKKQQTLNARLEAEVKEKAVLAEELKQVQTDNEMLRAELESLKRSSVEKDAKIDKLNVFNQNMVAALKTQTVMYEDAEKANMKKMELMKEIEDLKQANAVSAEKASKLKEVNNKLEALMKEQSRIFADTVNSEVAR